MIRNRDTNICPVYSNINIQVSPCVDTQLEYKSCLLWSVSNLISPRLDVNHETSWNTFWNTFLTPHIFLVSSGILSFREPVTRADGWLAGRQLRAAMREPSSWENRCDGVSSGEAREYHLVLIEWPHCCDTDKKFEGGGGGNVASAATEIELRMIQTTMRRRFSVSHELFLHGLIYSSDTPCLRSKAPSGRRNSLGTCSKMNSRTFVLAWHEEINFGLFFFLAWSLNCSHVCTSLSLAQQSLTACHRLRLNHQCSRLNTMTHSLLILRTTNPAVQLKLWDIYCKSAILQILLEKLQCK